MRSYMARVAWKKAHKPIGPTIGRLTTEASKMTSDANARENSSSVGRRTISVHASPGLGGCCGRSSLMITSPFAVVAVCQRSVLLGVTRRVNQSWARGPFPDKNYDSSHRDGRL